MLEIKNLGIGGAIGILIGIALVSWVQPTTYGGTGVLIVVPMIFCGVVGSVLSKIFGKQNDRP
jgi:hypothetical protein